MVDSVKGYNSTMRGLAGAALPITSSSLQTISPWRYRELDFCTSTLLEFNPQKARNDASNGGFRLISAPHKPAIRRQIRWLGQSD